MCYNIGVPINALKGGFDMTKFELLNNLQKPAEEIANSLEELIIKKKRTGHDCIRYQEIYGYIERYNSYCPAIDLFTLQEEVRKEMEKRNYSIHFPKSIYNYLAPFFSLSKEWYIEI